MDDAIREANGAIAPDVESFLRAKIESTSQVTRLKKALTSVKRDISESLRLPASATGSLALLIRIHPPKKRHAPWGGNFKKECHPEAAGWLLVITPRLLAITRRLLAFAQRLLAFAGWLLAFVGKLLVIVGRLLNIAGRLLEIANRLLGTAEWLCLITG